MPAATILALSNHRLAASALGRSLLGGGMPTGAPPLLAAGAPVDSQGAGSMRDSGGRPGAWEARPRRAKSARLAAQVAVTHRQFGALLQSLGLSTTFRMLPYSHWAHVYGA